MNTVLLSIISAFLSSFLLFTEKYILQNHVKDAFSWVVIISILSGVVCLPLLFFIPTITSALTPLFISAVFTIIGYVLYASALNSSSPSTIAILNSIRPTIAITFSVILLNEVYSTGALIWMAVIALAFILFSLTPATKKEMKNKIKPALMILGSVIAWVVGDSMISFSNLNGLTFVIGRNIVGLVPILVLYGMFKQKVKLPEDYKSSIKYVVIFGALALVTFSTFFQALSQSFAITNAVAPSMTVLFSVILGFIASKKFSKHVQEKGDIRTYAYKTAIALIMAIAVYNLYFLA